MKFDDIIIGGGLSGLMCGIRLQEAGRKCAIVSAGQNAMHFSSGSFDLLNRDNDGNAVTEPLKAIENLDKSHPYKKIGIGKITDYANKLKDIFREAGVSLKGEIERNSYMISPMGLQKSAWLALEDVELFDVRNQKIGDNILIVNIKGYLDFNTKFVADGLEKMGSHCKIVTVDMPAFDSLRSNPSEMRSVNIAGIMDRADMLSLFIQKIKSLINTEDTVVIPSVFGFKNSGTLARIKESVPIKTVFIGTMPPSIPGIRSQLLLKKRFEALGGTMLLGDEVISADVNNGLVRAVRTSNLGELILEAENYILASGSFFSKGLWATPTAIIEPLFGVDTDYMESRANWYDEDFFKTQAYLGFGVSTDNNFHPYIKGEIIGNLYAIGAVLGGYNPVSLGCGAGVAIMTALNVADNIIGSKVE
ncbi:MAG: anaerobic glycerol-3-phosphate dehydrogenase subunit GlpB [Candidatus Cryptobacteroides sp.]